MFSFVQWLKKKRTVISVKSLSVAWIISFAVHQNYISLSCNERQMQSFHQTFARCFSLAATCVKSHWNSRFRLKCSHFARQRARCFSLAVTCVKSHRNSRFRLKCSHFARQHARCFSLAVTCVKCSQNFHSVKCMAKYTFMTSNTWMYVHSAVKWIVKNLQAWCLGLYKRCFLYPVAMVSSCSRMIQIYPD